MEVGKAILAILTSADSGRQCSLSFNLFVRSDKKFGDSEELPTATAHYQLPSVSRSLSWNHQQTSVKTRRRPYGKRRPAGFGTIPRGKGEDEKERPQPADEVAGPVADHADLLSMMQQTIARLNAMEPRAVI